MNLHGNTAVVASPSSQAIGSRNPTYRMRRICFTAFKDPKLSWNASKLTYVVMQEEICPTTSRHHWQGYAELDSAYTLQVIKTKVFNDNTIHIETRMGTLEEAVAYCTKEDTRVDGTMYTHGEARQQGERTDIQQYAQWLTEDGKWTPEKIETFGHMLLKFPQGSKALADVVLRSAGGNGHRAVTVNVLYGDTGTGKTQYLYRTYDPSSIYVVPLGLRPWFPDYRNEDVLFFDEFNGEASGYPVEFFLKVCDSYPIRVETKGGFISLVHTKIVIASNVHPVKWWPGINERQYEALLRRLVSGGPIQRWDADESLRITADTVPEVIIKRSREDVTRDHALMIQRINKEDKPLEFPLVTSVHSTPESDSTLDLMQPAQNVPWRVPVLYTPESICTEGTGRERKAPAPPAQKLTRADIRAAQKSESAPWEPELSQLGTSVFSPPKSRRGTQDHQKARNKSAQKLSMGITATIDNLEKSGNVIESDCQNQEGMYSVSDSPEV